jgi:hypothetical protein
MADKKQARLLLGAPLVASGLMLAGCLGAPTYGTDKTASAQLADDVTGILSIAPKRRAPIDYKPRPELVKPASTAALPPPQDPVTVASNPAWPQSPEQRRAQIRAEATANQDNPAYDSPVIPDVAMAAAPHQASSTARSADSGSTTPSVGVQTFARSLQARLIRSNKQRRQRKYLSEPPLAYRQLRRRRQR